ncbi:hypothetical protein SISNIDRAFT_465819 [Sistotremastrum niveocremeum HHB9708]|uniref:MSP domain-containing protein n=1 Tax=Sistotremastrum niveocremeum HHB9708 TaxID=1314777 RepID=A0A164UXZ0_9AGAM|nr:hypothetical protein SISNIDRAFT_465819 [Sistotremastrum niveocremeum HHB9708]
MEASSSGSHLLDVAVYPKTVQLTLKTPGELSGSFTVKNEALSPVIFRIVVLDGHIRIAVKLSSYSIHPEVGRIEAGKTKDIKINVPEDNPFAPHKKVQTAVLAIDFMAVTEANKDISTRRLWPLFSSTVEAHKKTEKVTCIYGSSESAPSRDVTAEESQNEDVDETVETLSPESSATTEPDPMNSSIQSEAESYEEWRAKSEEAERDRLRRRDTMRSEATHDSSLPTYIEEIGGHSGQATPGLPPKQSFAESSTRSQKHISDPGPPRLYLSAPEVLHQPSIPPYSPTSLSNSKSSSLMGNSLHQAPPADDQASSVSAPDTLSLQYVDNTSILTTDSVEHSEGRLSPTALSENSSGPLSPSSRRENGLARRIQPTSRVLDPLPAVDSQADTESGMRSLIEQELAAAATLAEILDAYWDARRSLDRLGAVLNVQSADTMGPGPPISGMQRVVRPDVESVREPILPGQLPEVRGGEPPLKLEELLKLWNSELSLSTVLILAFTIFELTCLFL